MGSETLEVARLWAGPVLAFLGLAWTIYWSLMIARKSAAKAEQDKLAGELVKLKEALTSDEKSDTAQFGEMRSRLQKVEDDIKHLPTKEQVHSLELAMGDLKGDVREVASSIRPLMATIERINDFLMDQGKRA